MQTMRYMGEGGREKWITKLSDYQEHGGMMIPTVLEAGWQLKTGYFPYARFILTKIDFDKYEKF